MPTNEALRAMLAKCGLPARANKLAMQYELQRALQRTSPFQVPKESLDMVSIDVGLKNFSLARMAVPSLTSSHTTKPTLVQWGKLNLPVYCNVPNEFNPHIFAEIIDKLVFDLILGPGTPDIIVVERQRYRSQGGASVQEHVLKSNALEFMLFASLKTLQRVQGLQTGLYSSSPQTMANYWTDYYGSKRHIGDEDSKTIRMMLVDEWMQHLMGNTAALEPLFKLNVDPPKTIPAYRGLTRRVYESMSALNELNSPKYKVDIDDQNKKGDDVTDSLLHGISFIEFERNKQRLRESR